MWQTPYLRNRGIGRCRDPPWATSRCARSPPLQGVNTLRRYQDGQSLVEVWLSHIEVWQTPNRGTWDLGDVEVLPRRCRGAPVSGRGGCRHIDGVSRVGKFGPCRGAPASSRGTMQPRGVAAPSQGNEASEANYYRAGHIFFFIQQKKGHPFRPPLWWDACSRFTSMATRTHTVSKVCVMRMHTPHMHT